MYTKGRHGNMINTCTYDVKQYDKYDIFFSYDKSLYLFCISQ